MEDVFRARQFFEAIAETHLENSEELGLRPRTATGARDGKVHATAIAQGRPDESRARCGWLYVQTTSDVSRVTCRLCIKLIEAGKTAARRAKPVVARGVVEGLRDALLQIAGVPTAPPPPVLDPPTWQTVCRINPETQNRCGACVVCEHERELDRFAALDPYRNQAHDEREDGAPVFGSLNGALVALAEWRMHDRHAPSQLGVMLDRLRSGQTGGGWKPKRSNRLLDRADDISHVDTAVKRAFEAGDNPAYLRPSLAETLLLVRTPGVLRVPMPTYVQLSEILLEIDHVATPRQLKRTVRLGRRAVTVDLAARGLIRQPARASGLAEAIWLRVCDFVGVGGDGP